MFCYDINKSKGGDTLSKQIQKLSEKLIFDGLKSNGVECKVQVFSEIDSTNLEAKRRATAVHNTPMLFVADSQTAGRGRMGRQFYSPDSTGLYMSYMYTPDCGFSDSVTVTAAAAVAVARAIKRLTDLEPEIKWVNDIYIGGKKVCGILTEAVTGKDVKIIIGIGINITTQSFPKEIEGIADSLKISVDRNRLAARIVKELQVLISELSERSFIEEYRRLSCVLGRDVTFIKNGEERYGKAVDIDRDGGLVVQTSDGSITLNTGEISLKVGK